MIKLKQHDIFALYSLPYSEDYFMVQQESRALQRFDEQTIEGQGFVVQPFTDSIESPAIFIRKDKLHKNPIVEFFSHHQGKVKNIHRSTYLKQVETFIKATRQDYKKIIFSRIETIDLQTGDLFQLFMTLKELHRNAFVYLYNLPNIGCWMGASPEVLLKQHANNYETVALAGTQRDLGLPLENVVWGDKEVEEQAIVERYIEGMLQKENANYEKTAAYTAKAGKLLHLKTKFRFQSPNSLFNFLKNLHPTPAVCGIPKQAAKDFIIKNEAHKRAYYSGFLGPLNIEKQTNLFVNLRCMQVFEDKFALYIGGGITADSVGEKEWEETEIKSQTLTDVIERVYLQEKETYYQSFR